MSGPLEYERNHTSLNVETKDDNPPGQLRSNKNHNRRVYILLKGLLVGTLNPAVLSNSYLRADVGRPIDYTTYSWE